MLTPFQVATSSRTRVVESETSAARRGVRPYCRLAGFGQVGTPTPVITEPSPLVDTMALALDTAGVAPDQVGYCAAAAYGVPFADTSEAEALAKLFGDELPVGAPKSMVGETMASDGLVNVIAAALAVRDGLFAPVANLVEPAYPLNYVRAPSATRAVTTNDLLFGKDMLLRKGKQHYVLVTAS